MRAMGVLVLVCACGEDPAAPACPPVASECTPQYEPVFDQVYTNTIRRSCSVGGNSCHGGAAGAGGLDLSLADIAYEQLLERQRVVPNDPSCSTIIQRMHHEDPAKLMPPGARLSAEEICSVQKWIEAGAER